MARSRAFSGRSLALILSPCSLVERTRRNPVARRSGSETRFGLKGSMRPIGSSHIGSELT